MATPRKGPKLPSSSSTSSTKISSNAGAERKRWPSEDSAAPADTDLVSIVRGLAAAVAEHGLSELVVDTPDATFTLRRGGPVQQMQPMQMQPMQMQPMQMQPMPGMGLPTMSVPMMPQMNQPSGSFTVPPVGPAEAPPVEAQGHLVTSPFVGTFYRRSNPDSPEYVRVNDRVKKNQVLCIIEAMKLMNEIEADIDGTLVGVLAEDGAPVEYGQPLFKIAPA